MTQTIFVDRTPDSASASLVEAAFASSTLISGALLASSIFLNPYGVVSIQPQSWADLPQQFAVELRASRVDNLFDELLTFHQQLAASQRDLPEDATRVLRDRLWQLYD